MKIRARKRTKAEMLALKQRAIALVEANPGLAINDVARHFLVAPVIVSRWFKEEKIAKWFS